MPMSRSATRNKEKAYVDLIFRWRIGGYGIAVVQTPCYFLTKGTIAIMACRVRYHIKYVWCTVNGSKSSDCILVRQKDMVENGK